MYKSLDDMSGVATKLVHSSKLLTHELLLVLLITRPKIDFYVSTKFE